MNYKCEISAINIMAKILLDTHAAGFMMLSRSPVLDRKKKKEEKLMSHLAECYCSGRSVLPSTGLVGYLVVAVVFLFFFF